MNVKIDIHENNKTEKRLSNIPFWKVPESTKKEILLFVDKARIGQVNEGRKLSERTISKYLTLLKLCLEILKKETSKLTKEDVERFDKKLSSLNLKSESDYKRALKVFLNWKIGEFKTNKIAGWLDTRIKKKTPDYLSEEEVKKLFNYCKSPSEKFLISVLFDSGARAEEFLNIRFEDIQLPEGNNNFVKITLKEEYSKTNGRVISLFWVKSLNAVRDYLDERKNEGVKFNEPVFNKTYDGIRMFLSRLGKKVLNKKINPHLFRHSSATYYATRLNRQELCYRYGWAFSSTMPDVYISRAGMESKELDEKFKSTELESLQKDFDKYKFENGKLSEDMEKIKSLLFKFIFVQNSKTTEEKKKRIMDEILNEAKGKIPVEEFNNFFGH